VSQASDSGLAGRGSNRPKPQGVIGTKLHHHVLAVGARLEPDINGNIDNRAAGSGHRLGLRVRRRLAVQASQRAPSVGVGDVRLRDAGEQFDVGDSEHGAFWTAFLRSLKTRGLGGVQLVISDAHSGLRGAIEAILIGRGLATLIRQHHRWRDGPAGFPPPSREDLGNLTGKGPAADPPSRRWRVSTG